MATEKNMKHGKNNHSILNFAVTLFHFLIGGVCFIPALVLGSFVLFNNGPGYDPTNEVKGIWFAFIVFTAVVLVLRQNCKQKINHYTTYWSVLYLICLTGMVIMTALTMYG